MYVYKTLHTHIYIYNINESNILDNHVWCDCSLPYHATFHTFMSFKLLPVFIEISCFVQVLKLCREDMLAAQSISKEDSGHSRRGWVIAMGHDWTI